MEKLIGKVIKAIYLNFDKTSILFKTKKSLIGYNAEGECCSHSWFQHFEGVENILNKKITSIRVLENRSWGSFDEQKSYGIELSTNQGSALLEMRNNSNGYYGGGWELDTNPTLTDDAETIAKDF